MLEDFYCYASLCKPQQHNARALLPFSEPLAEGLCWAATEVVQPRSKGWGSVGLQNAGASNRKRKSMSANSCSRAAGWETGICAAMMELQLLT